MGGLLVCWGLRTECIAEGVVGWEGRRSSVLGCWIEFCVPKKPTLCWKIMDVLTSSFRSREWKLLSKLLD